MKNLILAAIFLGTAGRIFAQYNIATTYCNHNDLNSARYLPSEMDIRKGKRVQIGANYYLYAGNTALNYGDLKQIHDKKALEAADIDRFINSLKKENLFGIGQDYQVLGVGFQLRTKREKDYDFAFTIVDKFGASFLYSDNFLKLAWKGNKQFAGVKTELGPVRMDINYAREYCFGAAFPVLGREDNVGLRAGFRVKYIQGIASLYMSKSQMSIFTDTSGRFVSLDMDYQAHTAGFRNFSPFAFNGNGLGIDLGASIFLSKNITVAASLLDLGEISYTKDVRNFSKKGTFNYEGLIVGNLLGDPRLQETQDSIQYLFAPEKAEEKSYLMPLATRFIIQAEIKLPRKDFKDREYIADAFFLTYAQGLNNLPGTTTRPFFSVGYNHDFNNAFDAGLAASYGGFNGLALGAFFSFSFSQTLKVGLGSDNLTGLIYKKLGTGMDFSSNISLSF